jgi:hypothetical protein
MVGLFGAQINMPLVSAVINEYQVICWLWGSALLGKTLEGITSDVCSVVIVSDIPWFSH